MFDNITDLLMWFAVGGGAMYLFGVVEARLLENWEFYHKMKPAIKKLIPILFAGLIGVLAQSLVAVDVTQFIPEGVAAVILALINWYMSQSEYQRIKDSSYGVSTRNAADN